MQTFLKLSIVLATLVALLAGASPAAAASATKTITEAQINKLYRVTNPTARYVTERTIDLQSGQVVINEVWKQPKTAAVTRSWTFVPTLADGRVTWALTAATKDGKAISTSVKDQINASMSTSWVRWFKSQLPSGRITALTISDTEIAYTVETAR